MSRGALCAIPMRRRDEVSGCTAPGTPLPSGHQSMKPRAIMNGEPSSKVMWRIIDPTRGRLPLLWGCSRRIARSAPRIPVPGGPRLTMPALTAGAVR